MSEAISYKLPVFEGPLDLLLHLIAKNKLNIHDIPVSELVDQYIRHINLYKDENMDIASEFLEMAARLIYLKTVSLLPKQEDEAEELKTELTGELLEYQACQMIAKQLSTMTEGFELRVRDTMPIGYDKTYKRTHPSNILIQYYLDAAGRGARKLPPPAAAFSGIISKKVVSVEVRKIFVLRKLWDGIRVPFRSLFTGSKSRSEIVATFLAVLGLIKNKRVVTDEQSGETMIRIDKAGARHGRK